jgi:hypothetical protein
MVIMKKIIFSNKVDDLCFLARAAILAKYIKVKVFV